MTMGDRVAVLEDGVLQQVDTPRNLYDRPANVFVAAFMGSPAMNLVDADLDADGAVPGGRPFPLTQATIAALGRENTRAATIGFRPEAARLAPEGEGFPFEVVVVEELGSDAYAYGTLQTDRHPGVVTEKLLTIRVDARKPPMKGETIHLQVVPEDAHVFSAETGLRVSG